MNIGCFKMKNQEVKPNKENKSVEIKPTFTPADKTPMEIEQSREQITNQDIQMVVQDVAAQKPSSLLDDYYLRDHSEESAASSSDKHKDILEDMNEAYITRDGKLVLDFLQAVHAAEERQAELDAWTFSEEKRLMKEKYEKELKDARVRELMYAEREAILDKELNKERVKATVALKSLKEKLEEQMKT